MQNKNAINEILKKEAKTFEKHDLDEDTGWMKLQLDPGFTESTGGGCLYRKVGKLVEVYISATCRVALDASWKKMADMPYPKTIDGLRGIHSYYLGLHPLKIAHSNLILAVGTVGALTIPAGTEFIASFTYFTD